MTVTEVRDLLARRRELARINLLVQVTLISIAALPTARCVRRSPAVKWQILCAALVGARGVLQNPAVSQVIAIDRSPRAEWLPVGTSSSRRLPRSHCQFDSIPPAGRADDE